MVKTLVLQQLYNLADDVLEYQLLDRRSFLQFLDLTDSSSIPDAKTGQIVYASLVQAPVQRNKREEADTVKDGTMPFSWKPHKRAQKDVDARARTSSAKALPSKASPRRKET